MRAHSFAIDTMTHTVHVGCLSKAKGVGNVADKKTLEHAGKKKLQRGL